MKSRFGEKNLTKLNGIVLAVLLMSGALTIAIPSVLPSAYAAGNKPGKIDTFFITTVGSTSITLVWLPPTDIGSSAIQGYQIERQGPQETGYTIIGTNGPTDTNFTDGPPDRPALTTGTTYNYKVTAFNAAGLGPASTGRHATTLLQPGVTLSPDPANPTNSAFPVTATFTDIVTGFEASEVVITNGDLSGFSGSGSVYTFTVQPSINGLVTVNIPAGVAQDLLSNVNTASNTLSTNFDNVHPVITLLGSSSLDVELGSSYVDAGATAFDDPDGDITDSIVVGGIVDTSVLGTYTITYDVTDSVGNAADQVIRTVNVGD